MFGYIRIDKDTLSEQQYENYRAIYCSLCQRLSEEYSYAARLILSYDCTFYALLVMSLSKECPSFRNGRCHVNPTKKCSYCTSDHKALSQAAALSVSSAYFKLIDNISDSKGIKKLFYRILKPLFSRWREKAKKRHPFIDEAVKEMMQKQEKAENNPACTIDEAADPTASMLSLICSSIPENFQLELSLDLEKQKRVLSSLGYFLGRWIYLMDAADDFEDDEKNGGFNPYLIAGYQKSELVSRVIPALNHALSEALLSYGLLDKGRYDEIIRNVLYSACLKVQRSTLSKYQSNSDQTE